MFGRHSGIFLSAPLRGAFAFASLLSLLGACGQDGTVITNPGSGGNGQGAATSTSSGTAGGGGEAGAGGGGTGGGGQGGSPNAKPLSVVNWNTRNFFNDKVDDPGGADTIGSNYLLTASEYKAKRDKVAGVLAGLNPDIAVLAEIENALVLKDLQSDLKALGSDYPYSVLVQTNDIREIAVLSKVELGAHKSHQDENFYRWGTFAPAYSYTRDCLEVPIVFNGRKIVLLAVHFRSKFSPDDPSKRLAEAQHTRDIADAITAAEPDTSVIVLGDFNDTPGSEPYNAVINGNTQVGIYANASIQAQPANSQWTYDFMGMLELIDHQMSSPLLSPMLNLQSIQILHTAASKDASDHSPVKASYNVK